MCPGAVPPPQTHDYLLLIRILEGDDIAHDLNRVRQLGNPVDSLSADGNGIKGKELVTLLSPSLPQSYEPSIRTLGSLTDDRTFAIFMGMLLQESTRQHIADARQPEQRYYHSATAAFGTKYPLGGRTMGVRYRTPRGGGRMASTFGLRQSDVGCNTRLRKPAGIPSGKGHCFYCQEDSH